MAYLKSFVNRIAIALVVFAMTGVMAFAKIHSDRVTFLSSMTQESRLSN